MANNTQSITRYNGQSVNSSIADGVNSIRVVVTQRWLVRVMWETIQVQVIGSQTVLRLTANALLHHSNLRRANVVRKVAVGSIRSCQNLHLNVRSSLILILSDNHSFGCGIEWCVTKKARNPMRAKECSTPTILFSLTHLSTRWLDTIN